MNVSYARFDTAWGPAAAAWSGRGLCALELPGPGKRQLPRAIKRDYPEARPGDPGEIADLVRQVQDYFTGRPVAFSVTLDHEWATPFQRRVYEALMTIPYGRTMSYGEIARHIGNPAAARAVGLANAKNRIPLIVPCHRVIKHDGTLGGFSAAGGVGLKQRMLDLEKNGLGL